MDGGKRVNKRATKMSEPEDKKAIEDEEEMEEKSRRKNGPR